MSIFVWPPVDRFQPVDILPTIDILLHKYLCVDRFPYQNTLVAINARSYGYQNSTVAYLLQLKYRSG